MKLWWICSLFRTFLKHISKFGVKKGRIRILEAKWFWIRVDPDPKHCHIHMAPKRSGSDALAQKLSLNPRPVPSCSNVQWWSTIQHHGQSENDSMFCVCTVQDACWPTCLYQWCRSETIFRIRIQIASVHCRSESDHYLSGYFESRSGTLSDLEPAIGFDSLKFL